MKRQLLIGFFLAALLVLGVAAPASAQIGVQITIAPPPLNQLQVADLWRLQVVNPGRTPLTVLFEGEITEERDGLVVEGESAIITLRPGLTMLTGQQVEPVDIGYGQSKYERALVRTGGAPAGNYEICVRAIESASGGLLGETCITHEVNVLNPPILISPAEGETITSSLPTFVWTPATGAFPGRAQYRSRVVITSQFGRQSFVAAARTNPAWFEGEVPGTTLQYPASARRFQEGDYAWRVIAIDPETGREIASSDVGRFRWEPQQTFVLVPALLQKIPGIPNAITDELLAPCSGLGSVAADKDVIVLEQGTGGGRIIQPGRQLQINN